MSASLLVLSSRLWPQTTLVDWVNLNHQAAAFPLLCLFSEHLLCVESVEVIKMLAPPSSLEPPSLEKFQ
jgi:hypothetical protein